MTIGAVVAQLWCGEHERVAERFLFMKCGSRDVNIESGNATLPEKERYQNGFLLTTSDLAVVIDCSVRTCDTDLKWFKEKGEFVPFFGSVMGRSDMRRDP